MHVLFFQYYMAQIRAIDVLFNSNFFQSFWYDGKLISFQLYWSIKGLIFDILSGCLWFNAADKAYWKHLSSLLLGFIVTFWFLATQENLYMIHLYLNLSHEDYNAINQHYQKQIHFLSFFLLILIDIFAKEIQKVL